MKHRNLPIGLAIGMAAAISGLTGCWAAAAGAGAEAGYVATQDNRTASETIDDQRISTVVKTKLIADEDVKARNINVDVAKGVVTLRGFVANLHEQERAVEIARSVSGVKTVDSRLAIQ